MDKELEEEIHRAEFLRYLSEDELTLLDVKREELLIQRKLVDKGLLSEMDLIANRDSLQDAARRVAMGRNKFTLTSWFDSLPGWLQAVVVFGSVLLISIIEGILFD